MKGGGKGIHENVLTVVRLSGKYQDLWVYGSGLSGI